MATATATFTQNAYPTGQELSLDKIHVFGTIAVTADPDTYVTNGLPISFVTSNVYTQNTPFFATLYGTSGYEYVFDPVHVTLRMYLGGTEVTNGTAIPAPVSGDTIYADAVMTRT